MCNNKKAPKYSNYLGKPPEVTFESYVQPLNLTQGASEQYQQFCHGLCLRILIPLLPARLSVETDVVLQLCSTRPHLLAKLSVAHITAYRAV